MWVLEVWDTRQATWIYIGIYMNKDDLTRAERNWAVMGYQLQIRGNKVMWILDVWISRQGRWVSCGVYTNKDELIRAEMAWEASGYQVQIRRIR